MIQVRSVLPVVDLDIERFAKDMMAERRGK